MSSYANSLGRRSLQASQQFGKQNLGKQKWGMGVRREFGGGLGGTGGENPFGADGTRGGSSGQPVLLDKAVAMERARATTQKMVDSATAGAKARAAEMGLDYTPDQEALLAGAGAMASNANQAGFSVDQQNNQVMNQFSLQDKQNEQALKMQQNSISAQQNDPLAWAEFNQKKNEYGDWQAGNAAAAQSELLASKSKSAPGSVAASAPAAAPAARRSYQTDRVAQMRAEATKAYNQKPYVSADQQAVNLARIKAIKAKNSNSLYSGVYRQSSLYTA